MKIYITKTDLKEIKNPHYAMFEKLALILKENTDPVTMKRLHSLGDEYNGGQQSIISELKEIDIDKLVNKWIALPQNWQKDSFGNSGLIDMFNHTKSFSEFLEQELNK